MPGRRSGGAGGLLGPPATWRLQRLPGHLPPRPHVPPQNSYRASRVTASSRAGRGCGRDKSEDPNQKEYAPADEVQRERLPEIELSLVRYVEEFLAVADVIRQYVRVVPELGMIIELARLLAQKGLMLVPAVGADEFEGFQYVLQADRHGDPRRWGFPLCYSIIFSG